MAVAVRADAAETGERHRLRAIATIAAAVRDPPELWQTDDDAAHAGDTGSGALDAFRAKTERLAGRYARDCTIDLATAPLADLFAWCIAEGALTLQQDSSENLLLIRCKPPGDSPQPPPPHSDSSSRGSGGKPDRGTGRLPSLRVTR